MIQFWVQYGEARLKVKKAILWNQSESRDKVKHKGIFMIKGNFSTLEIDCLNLISEEIFEEFANSVSALSEI